jgi:hypothetical protein
VDVCYFLSGILIGDNGEEIGVRYQEFELGDGGLLRVSSTVVCKKEEVSDFLLSHEVFGGGDLCVARIDARTGDVIKRGHPKLIQILRFRDRRSGEELLRFMLCYLDDKGEYIDKTLSLDTCLERLHLLEAAGATVVDDYQKSDSLKPYLLFMRGILYSEAYKLERGRARLSGGDCSNISVYYDKETRSIGLQAVGMAGQSNGVNRYSAFVRRIEVTGDALVQASVRVVDLSCCDRLRELSYSASLNHVSSDNSMVMVFPKWASKVTDERSLVIEKLTIGKGRFEFRNFPSGAVFKKLTVVSGAELAGDIGCFRAETAVLGAVSKYGTLRGLKHLFIRVPLSNDTNIFVCDTDSEEISIEYEDGFYKNTLSILNCKVLRKVKIVSHSVLDLAKVLWGIKNCNALTELTIVAEYYKSRVEMGAGKLLHVLGCDGYKNLKVLRIIKKGNKEDKMQPNALFQVPKDCVVLCNSSEVGRFLAYR